MVSVWNVNDQKKTTYYSVKWRIVVAMLLIFTWILQMDPWLAHPLSPSLSHSLSISMLIHNYVHVANVEDSTKQSFCENVKPSFHFPVCVYRFMCVCVSVYYFFSLCSTCSIVGSRHDTWTIDNTMPRHYVNGTKFSTGKGTQEAKIILEKRRRMSRKTTHSKF